MNRQLQNRVQNSWTFLKSQPAFTMACNLALILLVYYLCRMGFFLVNRSYFPDMTFQHFGVLLKGGFQFDISAIMYTNSVYILLQVLPFKFRWKALYQKISKGLFVTVNSIAVIANCCDFAYFPFTNRRTSGTVFSEFQNESNLSKIFLHSLVEYWYVVLFGILLIYGIYKLYRKPHAEGLSQQRNKERSTTRHLFPIFHLPLFKFLFHTALMCLVIYATIIGMRGGMGVATRPITLSNANVYVNKSTEAAIVLNTPFCLIRTVTKKVYKNPEYFKDEAELAAVYSPLHFPSPQEAFKPLNVVIFIIESFGKEYSGFFNKGLADGDNGADGVGGDDGDGGTYEGYTPFADSLYAEGYTFEYSYANGRKSIDAMPSVLSSIPMFIEPYILTPYSTNDISSIASVLKEKGYYSAFFHGAPNGSMGFSAYAKSAGFDDYFGLDEYGNKDLDGMWAIWDEEFLQFYADKMGTMRQPFVTSVFTATSHHPFRIPERYEGQFPEGTQPIHKCIAYTDYALKRFFAKMSQYEWFENTLFVITADHTNQVSHARYFTDVDLYSVPILFYHPGSDVARMSSMPISQMDIMPSILGYLNYDKPYFAFGQDVFNTPETDKFACNYNNQKYQFFQHDFFMQFDGSHINAVYNYKTDPFLKNRVGVGVGIEELSEMETLLKAIIQQYDVRMIENRLTME